MASSCEGSHDKGSQISVKLIRRDDYTGASLPDLVASGRIQTNLKYITAPDIFSLHHSHSFSSKRVGVGVSSNRSSFR
jgi:hypothetical protein